MGQIAKCQLLHTMNRESVSLLRLLGGYSNRSLACLSRLRRVCLLLMLIAGMLYQGAVTAFETVRENSSTSTVTMVAKSGQKAPCEDCSEANCVAQDYCASCPAGSVATLIAHRLISACKSSSPRSQLTIMYQSLSISDCWRPPISA